MPRRAALILPLVLLAFTLASPVRGIGGGVEIFYVHNLQVPNHINWYNMSLLAPTGSTASTICLNGYDLVISWKNNVGTLSIPEGNATFHMYFINATAKFQVILTATASTTSGNFTATKWLNTTYTPTVGWNNVTFTLAQNRTLGLGQTLVLDVTRLDFIPPNPPVAVTDCISIDSITRDSYVAIDPVLVSPSLSVPIGPVDVIIMASLAGASSGLIRLFGRNRYHGFRKPSTRPFEFEHN